MNQERDTNNKKDESADKFTHCKNTTLNLDLLTHLDDSISRNVKIRRCAYRIF